MQKRPLGLGATALLIVSLLSPLCAAAQSTGGSFGGGPRGARGRLGGSQFDPETPTGGARPQRPSGPSASFTETDFRDWKMNLLYLLGGLAVVGTGVFLTAVVRRFTRPPATVVRFDVSLTEQAGRALQSELEALGAWGDPSTRPELAVTLQASLDRVLGASDAWHQARLAVVSTIRPNVGLLFGSELDDVSALLESASGNFRHGRPLYCLVNVVLACMGQLPAPPRYDKDAITEWLRGLMGLSAGDVLALEVRWSPKPGEPAWSVDELKEWNLHAFDGLRRGVGTRA